MLNNTLILSIIIGVLFCIHFSSPRKRILKSNSETVEFYLNFYNSILSDKSFDNVLSDIILETNDLHSLSWISWYADEKKKCDLIENLTEKCTKLKSIQDSVWTVKISRSLYRGSSKEMLKSESSICSNLEKLKIKCSSH